MTDHKTPVLIVGAGLAGLTTAAILAWRGIHPLLVERHAGTSQHPRARSINFRSMELLRLMGLEDELVAAGGGAMQDFGIIVAETVTGRELATLLPRGSWDSAPFSPARASGAGQNRVEPILRRFAEEHGAEIRVSTELVGITERPDAVEAVLRDRKTGHEQRVLADYLVAADGNRSFVRRSLSIGLKGRGTLSHNIAVVFTAERLPKSERKMALYYLRNPGFTGAYISPDIDGRALLSVEYDPQKEGAKAYDEARCVALIRAALGTADVEPRILEVNAWEMAAQTAVRFATRRVFLAGDAAHTMPPTGGLGGQTAIQDGFDIAWKLAMVLKGEAGARLLETYEAERKPVGERTVALQTANYAARLRPDRKDIASGNVDDEYPRVAFGYRYRSAAIIPDGSDDGALSEDPMRPSDCPGTRAAHLVFEARGRLVSTLDLIESGFVLLLGRKASSFEQAAARLIGEAGAPIQAFRLGSDLVELPEGDGRSFESCFGVRPEGAVLLRPDGFIAWRSRGEAVDAEESLTQAFAHVLCRPFVLERPEMRLPKRGAA